MNLLGINNKFLFYLIRIIGILAFLALPYAFTYGDFMVLPDIKNNMHDRAEFIIYLLIIVFFFLNTYVLLPYIYFAKRYLIYFSLIVILFASLIYLTYYFEIVYATDSNMVGHVFLTDSGKIPIVYTENIFLFLLVFFISLFIRTNYHLRITEKEKHNTELSYLKSQIKPHFLFNTLNSIYALAVKENAPNTAEGMLKLSGMMRYVVTEAANKFVPLEKEITYINNYVDLQKLRLDKKVKLTYDVKGRMTDEKIAPIILIPFIENAFKYGVSPDEDSNISIFVEIKPKCLEMIVENNKVTTVNEMNESTGHGIQITKNRLNLMYPNKHKLKITDTALHYKVHLLIFWK